MAFPSTYADIQQAVIEKATLDPVLDLPKTKDWINQVYFQAAVETEAISGEATMSLTSGSGSYALPAAVARIRQMAVQPSGSTVFNAPLILTTLDEILQRRQAGQQGSYPQATHYTVVGINGLEVWPTPAAADVISIYYVSYPTALSANTDVPVFEEPYASKILEYGALAEAGDFKGDPATGQWAADYTDWMGRYRAHLQRKRGVIPGQFHQWGEPSVSYGY
jgi:hypothetical protein